MTVIYLAAAFAVMLVSAFVMIISVTSQRIYSETDSETVAGNGKKAERIRILAEEDEETGATLGIVHKISFAVFVCAGVYALNAQLGVNIWLSGVILFFAGFFLFSLLPSLVAGRNPEKSLEALSGFSWAVRRIFLPVVVSKKKQAQEGEEQSERNVMSDEELISIVDDIEEDGIIDEKKGELIRSVIEFNDVAAYEVMTPRVDLFAYDIEDDISELIDADELYNYAKIPVYEDSPDNILGILSGREVLKRKLAGEKLTKEKIRAMLEPPFYTFRNRNISDIVKDFQEKKTHLAIVLDEFGGTMGIVTMEDILEELVGDIWDETDTVEEGIVKTAENEFILDGDTNIEDFFDHIDVDDVELPDTEYTTMGGLAINQLGQFPKEGDVFEVGSVRFTVLRVVHRRVESLKAFVTHDEKEDEKED